MDYSLFNQEISKVNINDGLNDDQFQHSESTSSASQQNRQEKLCSVLDELCIIFESKQNDKSKKEMGFSRQVQAAENLICSILKNLEYENFNSKFFGSPNGEDSLELQRHMKRMNKLQGKFMCDLPLSEDMAMKYHAKIKNIIRVNKVQMKDFGLKDKVRSIQDQLQRIKICHANRRRQREHREQNKQYREEFFQKSKTADNTPTEEMGYNKSELHSEDLPADPQNKHSNSNMNDNFMSIVCKSQESIQMEHLKIMNTNMMLEICSNELQIAIKEQKLDMQQVQEKISNILQQVNKQKLLLFNNFQNITKSFNEQKKTLEGQTLIGNSETKINIQQLNSSLLMKRKLTEPKFDSNNIRFKMVHSRGQQLSQMDQSSSNENKKGGEAGYTFVHPQKCQKVVSSKAQQVFLQEDSNESQSEQFFKLEPNVPYNQPLKINFDQRYELQSVQENLVNSTCLSGLNMQSRMQQIEEKHSYKLNAGKQSQMLSEPQVIIAGQNTNLAKKSIWMNQTQYKELKQVTVGPALRTPVSKRQKSSSNEASATPLFN